ncbi:transcriptional regulator [Streptomyces sp. L7]
MPCGSTSPSGGICNDLARAGRQRPRGRRLPPERVTEENAQLLDVLGDTPAIVQGRCADVLAWNRLGHALFAGHLDPGAPDRPTERPNLARLVFLDPHIRDLYADWPSKARAVVGNLRLMAGRFPDDAALHALVGELSAKSGEFASMWADHRVKSHMFAAYDMRHPLVGPLTVVQQSLGLGRGISLVVATTPAGSPSRAALALLAQAAVPAEIRVDPVPGQYGTEAVQDGRPPAPRNQRIGTSLPHARNPCPNPPVEKEPTHAQDPHQVGTGHGCRRRDRRRRYSPRLPPRPSRPR